METETVWPCGSRGFPAPLTHETLGSYAEITTLKFFSKRGEKKGTPVTIIAHDPRNRKTR